MKMRLVQCIYSLAIISQLTGCSSGLSRSKAQNLIIKYLDLHPFMGEYTIRIGSDAFLSGGDGKSNVSGTPVIKDWLIEWASQGLLRCTFKSTKYSNLVNISLTDEGKKYVIPNHPGSQDVHIKFADKEFVQIVGIKLAAGNKEADVEYTWKFSKSTPFVGRELSSELNKEHAKFALYDDGWRIEEPE